MPQQGFERQRSAIRKVRHRLLLALCADSCLY